MTPKEKAKELVNKFTIDLEPFSEYGKWDKLQGKTCALIAVDEILNNFGLVIYGKPFYTSSNTVFFYKEVKEEIEKL
jgi:hypothetical protein